MARQLKNEYKINFNNNYKRYIRLCIPLQAIYTYIHIY